jgi:L-fuculose-phosphate aldolase
VNFADERAEIAALTRRLVADGLCVGTAGNLSVRCDDAILITPSGRDPEHTQPADVCVVGLDGRPRAGDRLPSSELPMHLVVYRATEAGAIVHTHAPYATTLSTTLTELPAIHYTITALGGAVRVATYATFGTEQLAANLRSALVDRSAAILQNHGTLTYGHTLREAYDRAVLLEWLCGLYWRAVQVGEPRILTEAELGDARTQAERLGYPGL